MTLKATEINIKTIISGSPYYIEKECAKIAGGLNDAEIHSFFADEIIPDEFFITLFTPSLFYERKAVFVHRIENYKEKELAAFFEEICKALNVSLVITFTAAQKDDEKKRRETLKKKLDMIADKVKPMGFKFLIENKQTEASLAAEIMSIFSNNGLKITIECAERIRTLVDDDLSRAVAEAEKLSLFCADKKLPSQDLLGYISGQIREDRFHFIDILLGRATDKCLTHYSQLPEIEIDAEIIFGMLRSYYAALYFKLKAPSLIDPKNPLFSRSLYFMHTINNVFRHWKAEEVAVMIETMAQLDIKVKTGRIKWPDALMLIIGKTASLNLIKARKSSQN
ncbi:MAG: hypothetical protein LBH05_04055 [Deferribacteraceae bacterium]|jgi:DNA polymerase III delta subunit|nr:hypothetical protein [Deferribacteraceae bacterium]